MIDEIKMRSKKKCETENRKTQILLQATIFTTQQLRDEEPVSLREKVMTVIVDSLSESRRLLPFITALLREY
jgi:hypothetical protein